MSGIRRICVYCGANVGARPAYAEAAQRLGQFLGERGLGLVYGGGNVGLMGVLADAALLAGAEVVGVIPRALMARELGHQGCTVLRVVETMHERKASMAEFADAFIALPGGLGTLDELFESMTWAQLGLHQKADRAAGRGRILRAACGVPGSRGGGGIRAGGAPGGAGGGGGAGGVAGALRVVSGAGSREVGGAGHSLSAMPADSRDLGARRFVRRTPVLAFFVVA